MIEIFRVESRNRLFTRSYCALVIIGAFNCLFGQSSLATIPVLLDSRSVSESTAAMVNMLFPLTCVVFRRYAIKIAFHISAKLSIFFSFITLALSNIFMEKIQTVGWVILIRISQGLAICYIAGVAASLVAETVPSDRFEEGVGYFSIGIPIMSFFGPALCRILLLNFNYSQMLYGLSAIMMIPLMIILMFPLPNLKPVLKKEVNGKEPFIEKNSIFPSILLMGFFMAATCIVSFFPLYAQRYKLNYSLAFYVAAGIGVFAVRLLFTVFKKDIPQNVGIPSAIVILTFVLLSLPKVDILIFNIFIGVLYGMAIGIIQPHFISMALNAVESSYKSIATVTYYLFIDIGSALGNTLWGYIAQYVDYYAVFIVAAAINVITFLGWRIFIKKWHLLPNRRRLEV